MLKRLYGVNLYDCMHRGQRIPVQVIRDVDEALEYAERRGLHPHDIHGRNVIMHQKRGFVADISDFLHEEPCSKWDNLKKGYYWLYRPFISPFKLRIPYFVLDIVRKTHRRWTLAFKKRRVRGKKIS